MFEHLREEKHVVESDKEQEGTKTVNIDAVNFPGSKISKKHIRPKDLTWRDIGSGTVAKTFVGATRMWTTTKNGPAIEDVYLRRIWSLSRAKLIDECEIDQTPDEVLRRPLPEPDDIRVELI